jgi:hypothetical protein
MSIVAGAGVCVEEALLASVLLIVTSEGGFAEG